MLNELCTQFKIRAQRRGRRDSSNNTQTHLHVILNVKNTYEITVSRKKTHKYILSYIKKTSVAAVKHVFMINRVTDRR